jgi:ferric-dicitrate binding protein FerR (iron transport regulator)
LKGEVYFNIRHDDAQDFIIDINGVYIRDIGTAFNVRAPEGGDAIEVVVNDGEVMFYTAEDSGVYLKEGAKGVYHKQLRKFTIEQPEANVLAYKTHVFEFNNTDLASVVQQLNNVYDKKIVLSRGARNCRLTVGFHNESQSEIIGIITETLGLHARETDDSITLEGTGCEP